MNECFIIALAGAIGALSRWGLGKSVHSLMGNGFPYGTLTVNVVGCFLIGLIMPMGVFNEKIPVIWRTAATVGFLGAFTTFSAFSYETIQLIHNDAWMAAAINITANVLLGLTATAAGVAISKTLLAAC